MNASFDERREKSPRPDRVRADWIDLGGEWEFELDPTNLVDGDRLRSASHLSARIVVPFPHESSASGVGDAGFYPTMWYRRSFDLPREWEGRRVLLNFGAVDAECRVWVNGVLAGEHRGGYSPFRFDVTSAARMRDNTLLVKVTDTLDPAWPRGKQSWGSRFACWYTPMSGIWQPVWLEAVGERYLSDVEIEVGDPASGLITVTVRPDNPCDDAAIRLSLSRDGKPLARESKPARFPSTRFTLRVEQPDAWSPESPVLYDVEIELTRGTTLLDRVESYAAFRSIEAGARDVLLNGAPRFLRLVLDQGHWPDTLFAPPSGEALRRDVELGKALGFDGCRKHIKAEDPRFLYWADRLGYLVWSEFPAFYRDTEPARLALLSQWLPLLARDRGHPAVIANVIYNESWGVPEVANDSFVRSWVQAVARIGRSFDRTRLFIDNDGWEQVDSDCVSYHSYAPDGKGLAAAHRAYLAGEAPHGRRLVAAGGPPEARPIIASEVGGIGYRASGGASGWGYAGVPGSEAEFFARFESLFAGLRTLPELAGYCYTQLTDVEQEINGLLTPERVPKFPIERIRRIVQR